MFGFAKKIFLSCYVLFNQYYKIIIAKQGTMIS